MLINNINPKTGKPLIPSLSALMAISQGLGMSLDELFEKIDDLKINIENFEKIPVRPLSNDERDILKLFNALSPEKKKQASNYLQYLSTL